MKNNKLIKYKDNIFIKIYHFFKKLFSIKNVPISKNIIEEASVDSKSKTDFFKNIQIQKNEEEIRLKKLQLLYDNGEIDEDDLSEEEIEKLVILYEKEMEELNADTERRKIHIQNMLKEIKN